MLHPTISSLCGTYRKLQTQIIVLAYCLTITVKHLMLRLLALILSTSLSSIFVSLNMNNITQYGYLIAMLFVKKKSLFFQTTEVPTFTLCFFLYFHLLQSALCSVRHENNLDNFKSNANLRIRYEYKVNTMELNPNQLSSSFWGDFL